MKPVELYCRIRGHRFVAYKRSKVHFKGIGSTAGRCVRCHESLWMIED